MTRDLTNWIRQYNERLLNKYHMIYKHNSVLPYDTEHKN